MQVLEKVLEDMWCNAGINQFLRTSNVTAVTEV